MEDDPSLFFQAEESGEADYLSLPSTGAAATTARAETASTCLFTALRRPPRPPHSTLSCAHARSGIRQRGGRRVEHLPHPRLSQAPARHPPRLPRRKRLFRPPSPLEPLDRRLT